MKTTFFLATIFPATIVCSCSGIMPGVGILAPKSISGYRMDFSDLEGTHEYRFSKNGTYAEKCTPEGTSKSTVKSGQWKWTKNRPSRAILTLDDSETLRLTFTTDDHANGLFDGDDRIYAFEFSNE